MLDFLTHPELERGLTRNTLEAYRVDLLQFGAFVAHHGLDALALEHAQLGAFVGGLADGRAGVPRAGRRCSARPPACARSAVTCTAAK